MFAIRDRLTAARTSSRVESLQARPPVGTLRLVRLAAPRLMLASVMLCAIGLVLGFSVAPSDIGRGELFRIAYVHVPATWAALLLYAVIVCCAVAQMLAGARLASMLLEAVAPTAAVFALLALWTGSLWSKAALDVWWSWDARRLADLTLLAFALGCVLLREMLGEGRPADVATAVLALLGGVVLIVALRAIALVPQVDAHPVANGNAQGVAVFGALTSVAAGFVAYAAAVSLKRLRCVILERDRGCEWIQQGSEL